MYIRNSIMIDINKPIEFGGVTYPAPINPNWFVALGITEVADPQQPDSKLYTSTRNVDGTWSSLNRPLAEVKAAKLQKIRQEAEAVILAKYGVTDSNIPFRMLSAALDVYPKAYKDTMKADIAAVISVSNDAEAFVEAATGPTAASDVVSLVAAWPVI